MLVQRFEPQGRRFTNSHYYLLFCSLVRKFDHTLVRSCNAHKDWSELSYSSFLLCSGFREFIFSDFFNKLKSEVKNLSFWCAGLEKLDQLPFSQDKRLLDSPLRTPPKVTKEVSKSSRFKDRRFLSYNTIPTYAATSGPEPIYLKHYGQAGHQSDRSPQGCRRCGKDIADKLKELHVVEEGESNTMRLVRHAAIVILCIPSIACFWQFNAGQPRK